MIDERKLLEMSTYSDNSDVILEEYPNGEQQYVLSEEICSLLDSMTEIVDSLGYEVEEGLNPEEFIEAVESLITSEEVLDEARKNWLKRAARATRQGFKHARSAVKKIKKAVARPFRTKSKKKSKRVYMQQYRQLQKTKNARSVGMGQPVPARKG